MRMPLKAEVLGESHEGASWPVRQQRVHQTLCSKFALRGCSMERVELNQARVCIVGLGGVSCAWTTGGAGYWTSISAGLLHRCSSSSLVTSSSSAAHSGGLNQGGGSKPDSCTNYRSSPIRVFLKTILRYELRFENEFRGQEGK